MNRATLLALVGLAGCNGNRPDDPPDLLDTGWFENTGDPLDPNKCLHKFVSWTPEDGAQGVYWRDKPLIHTTTNVTHAYNAWLETAEGERLNTQMLWSDDPEAPGEPGLSFTLDGGSHLKASTNYVMGLQDCAETRYVAFRTSSLGTPFSIETEDLAGRTYLLDLLSADWEEPPGLGQIMQSFFTTPILLGVRYADETRIDLIGSLGKVDALGNVTQDRSMASWDFPLTDFTSAPYLETRAEEITLRYDDYDIPVEDFLLESTFSADGSTIGGGVISGFADTRYMGPLLQGGEDAVCKLAATIAVNCQPCTDGAPYCLRLRVSSVEGILLPGLELDVVD